MFQVGIAHENEDDAEQCDDDRTGEVGFQNQKCSHDCQCQQQWQQPFSEGAHVVVVLFNEVGEEDDDTDLHQLRGLEVESADVQPAGCTALCDAQRRHKCHDCQQDHRKHIGEHGNRRFPEHMIIHGAESEHDDQSHNGILDLVIGVERTGLSLRSRPRIAGGEHHDDPDDQQCNDDQKKRHIHFAIAHVALPQRQIKPALLL